MTIVARMVTRRPPSVGLLSAGTVLPVAGLLLAIGSGCASVLFAWSSSVAIVAATEAETLGRLTLTLLLCLGAFTVHQLCQPLLESIGRQIQYRIDGQRYQDVVAALTNSRTVAGLQLPDTQARISDAVDPLEAGANTPGEAAMAQLVYVARYAGLVCFATVIGFMTSMWYAMAILGAVVVLRSCHKAAMRMYTRIYPRTSRHRREAGYFRDLMLDNSISVAIYAIGEWLTQRYRAAMGTFLGILWRERRRANIKRFVVFAIPVFGFAGLALGGLALSWIDDGVDRTVVLFTVQATVASLFLGQFYHDADNAAEFGRYATRSAAALAGTVGDDPAQPAPEDGFSPARQGLCLDGVCYAYPNSERLTIQSVNALFPPGAVTAVVGRNGAGKSTLIRLLAGVLEPSAGTVRWHGQVISSRQENLAVVGQVPVRFHTSVRDNITCGRADRGGALGTAVRKAELESVLAALPSGIDTRLDPQGGLSGGQWQRVALARAFFAVETGAQILVLDEPTSALDAESELRILAAVRDYASRGVAVVVITHRLSTVRMVDRIYLLDGGTVRECDPHEELPGEDR